MHTVAVLQARMGSTRLPGKVMLPLDGKHVLQHVVHRTETARAIDRVVVATSQTTADDIVARYAERAGAGLFRGSESDVLNRMYRAAEREHADVVVRITADCPLVSPDVIDYITDCIITTGADYVANIIGRTFPRGLDVEAFTFESFERVEELATDPHHREHVTPYYREHEEHFDTVSVSSDEIFDKDWMHDRTDIRLTLDEADDYDLLRAVYEMVEYDGVLPVQEAVRCIDQQDLRGVNAQIDQKELGDAPDDTS